MTTVRFMSEKVLFWVPTHIFIQHMVFMAVFDWILGWCQFTPPSVSIHPSCANSPRPVVNFLFFNKTKLEVPEVLEMYMCRAFIHSFTHICNNILAVSMTSLEAIKKGVPIRPVLPYNTYNITTKCTAGRSHPATTPSEMAGTKPPKLTNQDSPLSLKIGASLYLMGSQERKQRPCRNAGKDKNNF